jgi:putative membrane protein
MTIVLGARFLRYGLIAGGLLVAEGGGEAADAPPAHEAADASSTADVLGTLHQSDLKEVQAGEIAQKDGKSKAVRDYGKMLVNDHTAADKKVADVATKENIDLRASTPAPGPNDMGTMATGPDFDQKFAQEMLDDHRKNLAAVLEARDRTNDPQLRRLLDDVIPTLEKHEAAAQKIIDAHGKK